MKKFKISVLIFAILFLVIESARGESLVPGTKAPTTTTAPTMTTNDMNNNMNQAAGEQKKGGKQLMIVGAGLGVAAVICYNQKPPPMPWCHALTGGAIIAGIAGMHNNKKGDDNKKFTETFTVDAVPSGPQLQPTPPPGGDGKPPPLDTGGGPMLPVSYLKPLIKVGVKFDPKKQVITTPDGKTFPVSAFTSASSMGAAGLNPSDFGKLMDAAKKIEKDPAAKGIDGAENSEYEGGGGSNGKISAEGSGFQGPSAHVRGGINRDPAQVAGLTKTLNGEPIGVASDSIFGIIDRRYEFHDKKGSFLNPQGQ